MAAEWARVLQHREGFELVGVVSNRPEPAHNFSRDFGPFDVYESISHLYRLARPTAVIVAVPELATRGVLEQVWEHEWTCIVEKPAGHTFAEAVWLNERADAVAAQTFIALNRRYYESVRAAQGELVDVQGPRFVRVIDQHDTNAALASGQPPAVVANWHYANAIHTVDLLRFLSRGEPRSVKSSRWNGASGSFVLEAEVDFSSGDRASYTSYWNTPSTWHLSVNTPRSRVLLDPLERAYRQLSGSRELEELPGEGRDLVFKPGLSGLVDHLARQLMGLGHSLVSLGDGVQSMRLIDAIYREYLVTP